MNNLRRIVYEFDDISFYDACRMVNHFGTKYEVKSWNCNCRADKNKINILMRKDDIYVEITDRSITFGNLDPLIAIDEYSTVMRVINKEV